MNWEREYDREKDEEQRQYREALYADYLEQFGDPITKKEDPGYTYLWYLTTRMFYEGNPAKEPRLDDNRRRE